MLKNGKFIKEPPIKIGAHYVPPPQKPSSEDEWIIQNLILQDKQERRGIFRIDYILYAGFGYLMGYMIVQVLEFISENFFG